mmetsp:Transcript_17173/g.43143  ORF Transcript_17173/g.43143 Transcript_17173/m.43143 type:complete len:203 (-) Transcript_17173:235-843(-)
MCSAAAPAAPTTGQMDSATCREPGGKWAPSARYHSGSATSAIAGMPRCPTAAAMLHISGSVEQPALSSTRTEPSGEGTPRPKPSSGVPLLSMPGQGTPTSAAVPADPSSDAPSVPENPSRCCRRALARGNNTTAGSVSARSVVLRRPAFGDFVFHGWAARGASGLACRAWPRLLGRKGDTQEPIWCRTSGSPWPPSSPRGAA